MTIISAWSSLALAATFVAAVGLAAAAAPQNLDAPSDVGGVPADAEVTDSGLAHKVLQEGTGSRRPNRLSTVSVHYTGWLTNGTLFDSS
ncbi:MAG: FKBP-type peptidyl-prolyl cis-trans isomerase, partial [Acidobacteria bacterium]|nr:FKBP-type peptidyl-prolyl cis-trans isomerase [Acidobacteriota bacterium]